MGIVDFLTARLDEDEAAAHEDERAPGFWSRVFHPARVLAEVAAKRAILALHSPEDLEYVNADGDDRTGTVCATCHPLVGDWPCDTLKLLVAPHADHPDYKSAWRVE